MAVRALFERDIHPFLVSMSAFRLEGAFSLDFVLRYVGRLEGLELRDVELQDRGHAAYGSITLVASPHRWRAQQTPARPFPYAACSLWA